MFWENSQFSNLDNVSRNFFIYFVYYQSQEKKVILKNQKTYIFVEHTRIKIWEGK